MFIELEFESGEKTLINVNQIVHVGKYYKDYSCSVIGFNSSGGQNENYMIVKNSYDEIFNYLLESGNIFNK